MAPTTEQRSATLASGCRSCATPWPDDQLIYMGPDGQEFTACTICGRRQLWNGTRLAPVPERPALVDALAAQVAQAEQDNLTLTGQLVFLAARLEGLTEEVKGLRAEVATLRRAVVDNAGYAERCMEDSP